MIGSVRAAAAAAPVVLVTDSLTNVRGYKLHARYWSPGACAVRGSVFLCHGFGEHLGWYEELAAALVTEGLLVFGHDHQVQHHIAVSPYPHSATLQCLLVTKLPNCRQHRSIYLEEISAVIQQSTSS